MKLGKFKWSQWKTSKYDKGIINDKPYHNPKDKSLKIEEHETVVCLIKSTGDFISGNIYIDVYEKA